MKHLKTFLEAVIRPYDFDTQLDELRVMDNITKDILEEMLSPMDVEFVDVEYFKSKLQTKKEIELVPENMPPMLGGMRFAAHNIYTNKMYVCVIWKEFLIALNKRGGKNALIDFLREILRHESIHKQQGERRTIIKRNLENSPIKPKEYFGSTDEIMAYAQSFIDQCKKIGMSDSDILNQIKGVDKNGAVSWVENVYSKMPEDVLKRFKKYVYQYITT